MKRFVAATIAAVTLLIPSGVIAAEGVFSSKIKGNGTKIIENRQSAMRFSDISVSGGINLTISERRDGDILIRTDENIMPYVKMEVHNGKFRAWLEQRQDFEGEVRIDIDMPYNGRIDEISAYAASTVRVMPLLEADEVEISASGASRITANIRAKSVDVDLSGASVAHLSIEANETELAAYGASTLNLSSVKCRECELEASGASKISGSIVAIACDCDASGASKVTLSGTAHNADFEFSGASKLNASEFVTENCKVEASGASVAYVNCTSTLSAEASGASKIGYSGNCHVRVNSDSVFKQK